MGSVQLSTPLAPSAITSVVVTMDDNGQTFPDNFDLGGLHVWMSDVQRPSACLVDLSGDLGCDGSQPSCTSLGTLGNTTDTGVARLSANNDCGRCLGECTCGSGQGLTATFGTASSGNPDLTDHCGGAFAPGPALDPIDTVEVIIDTFDDDLDSGNLATVSLLDASGTTTLASRPLNPGGVRLPNGTEKALVIPGLAQPVGKIEVAVTGGGSWHVSGIRAVGRRTLGVGAPGAERCLFRYAADEVNPPIVFDGSNPSHTYAAGACD